MSTIDVTIFSPHATIVNDTVNVNVNINDSVKRDPNRCTMCNKKTGLLGFTCKCDGVFCAKHRHIEEHKCTYDHKKDQLEILKKNNPVVTSDKVIKI